MSKDGFTLVELAVVLTIIGLLIGGILKGQQLLVNARVQETIEQIQSYHAGMTVFKDKYGQTPGDMSVARKRLPNCNDENFCYDGNGDWVIGEKIPYAPDQDQHGVNTIPKVETSMFWKHLALADLISGVNPAADPTKAAWGVTHPKSPLRGGFIISTKTGPGSPDFFPSGHLIMIVNGMPRPPTYPLTAFEAALLDRKMDDGRPNAGYVAGEPVFNGCKTTDGADGAYGETNLRTICNIYFRMD